MGQHTFSWGVMKRPAGIRGTVRPYIPLVHHPNNVHCPTVTFTLLDVHISKLPGALTPGCIGSHLLRGCQRE